MFVILKIWRFLPLESGFSLLAIWPLVLTCFKALLTCGVMQNLFPSPNYKPHIPLPRVRTTKTDVFWNLDSWFLFSRRTSWSLFVNGNRFEWWTCMVIWNSENRHVHQFLKYLQRMMSAADVVPKMESLLTRHGYESPSPGLLGTWITSYFFAHRREKPRKRSAKFR